MKIWKQQLLFHFYSTENVHIIKIEQCPYSWPNQKLCVEIVFALPLLLDETSMKLGYQLVTGHIDKMWIRLADKYLKNYAFIIYSIPDDDYINMLWIVFASTILIIAFIFLLAGKYITQCLRRKINGNPHQ